MPLRFLFFAITGAVQTFSLHETTKGSTYQPPRILVVLGQIHKKQTPIVPARKAQPTPDSAPKSDKPAPVVSSTPTPAPASPEEPKQHNALPLKIFFLLVAIGLCLSTFSGISMAYRYTRNTAVITTLLILGAVVPVLMIVL